MKLSTAILDFGVTTVLAACAAPTDSVSADQSDLQVRDATTVAASGVLADRTTGKPIPAAKICVVDSTLPCAASATDGSYTVQVPANTDVAISISEAAHATNYITVTTKTDAVALGPLRIMDHATDAAFTTSAGGTADPTTGTLVVVVFDAFPHYTGVVAGVSLTDSDDSGIQYYTNTSGNPDSTLSATSNRGVAGFVNVAPGTQTMWLAEAGMHCNGALAWASPAGAGAMKTKIFAGATTVVYATCAP